VSGSNSLAVLEDTGVVSHITTRTGFEPRATVWLMPDTPVTAPRLLAAATTLSEKFDDTNVALEVTSAGFCLTARMGYGLPDEDFQEKLRQLRELVRPVYACVAAASAEVKRREGRHVSTLVRLSIGDGELPNEVTADAVEKVDGVLRAQILRDRRLISFSMDRPSLRREDFTEVARSVAALANCLVVAFDDILDREPEAALDPVNDYRPFVNG
jgi:hypothetical protein